MTLREAFQHFSEYLCLHSNKSVYFIHDLFSWCAIAIGDVANNKSSLIYRMVQEAYSARRHQSNCIIYEMRCRGKSYSRCE